MPTSARSHASEADLLRMPKDGRKYELVDGQIRVSPAGARHGLIIVKLTGRLQAFVERARLGYVFDSSTGIRLPKGNVQSRRHQLRCPRPVQEGRRSQRVHPVRSGSRRRGPVARGPLALRPRQGRRISRRRRPHGVGARPRSAQRFDLPVAHRRPDSLGEGCPQRSAPGLPLSASRHPLDELTGVSLPQRSCVTTSRHRPAARTDPLVRACAPGRIRSASARGPFAGPRRCPPSRDGTDDAGPSIPSRTSRGRG